MPTTQANAAARIAIWSPGTFTALSGDAFTFTGADCQAIAEAYSPALFSAPMVKGHPRTDDPAQGWAESLEWDGEYLWADVDRLDPAFADEWQAGRWGKVSPRFFLPDEPGNPSPGHYYLRHIGMLGAAAPANKGLPRAEFAEGEGTVTFIDGPGELPDAAFGERDRRWGFMALGDLMRRFREMWIADKGLDAANDLIPEHLITTLHNAGSEDEAEQVVAGFCSSIEESAMPDIQNAPEQQAAFAEQQAQLEQREAAIADRERAIAEQQAEAHRGECAAFAEQLADQGRIAPADQAFVAALLADIQPDAQVAFAESGSDVTVGTAERLRAFLSGLPVQIDYAERGAPEGDDAQAAGQAFAAPSGFQVDAGRADLHRQALAYQQQHNCDYATAAQAVGA